MIVLLVVESRFSDILAFVRRADTVVTYVTDGNPITGDFKFALSEKAMFERNRLDSNGKFRLFKKGHRDDLIAFLKGVALPGKGQPTGCFFPHHFLYVAKGAKQVRFDICFTCGGMEISGRYDYFCGVNRAYLAKTDKLFGMKFATRDPIPSLSIEEKKVERPTYDISILKGKGKKL